MTKKNGVSLGQLVMTRGVNDLIADNEAFAKHVADALARYRAQDWGDLGTEDSAMNDAALASGDDRIFARYNFPGDCERDIYIITEWDRSVTTLLFPSEY